MKKWKVLKSERVFDNKWFKVQKDAVELANGKIMDDFLYYIHGDFVVIVPVTDKNEVIFEKIYRHGVRDFQLEIPSGMVDEGENAEHAAKRELLEETGYISDEFEFLGKFVSMPGKVESFVPIFWAKNVQNTHEQHLEEDEDIELIVLPMDEVLKKIKAGEIINVYMITAIYFVCQKLGISIN